MGHDKLQLLYIVAFSCTSWCTEYRVEGAYHQDVVGLSPRTVLGGDWRVASLQDDVRSGVKGGVGEHGVVDHNFLVRVVSVDLGQARRARKLCCAGGVCCYKESVVLHAHSHTKYALQGRKSCKAHKRLSRDCHARCIHNTSVPQNRTYLWD